MSEITNAVETGASAIEAVGAVERALTSGIDISEAGESVSKLGEEISNNFKSNGLDIDNPLEGAQVIEGEGVKIGERVLSKEEFNDAVKSLNQGKYGDFLEKTLPKEQFDALTEIDGVNDFFKEQEALYNSEGMIITESSIQEATNSVIPSSPEERAIADDIDALDRNSELANVAENPIPETREEIQEIGNNLSDSTKSRLSQFRDSISRDAKTGLNELVDRVEKAAGEGVKSFLSGRWVSTALKIGLFALAGLAAWEIGYWLYSNIKHHQHAMNGCWLLTKDGKKKITNLSCNPQDVKDAKNPTTVQCQEPGCDECNDSGTGSCSCCGNNECKPANIKGKYVLSCNNSNIFQAAADIAKEPLDAAGDVAGDAFKNIVKIIIFIVLGIIAIFLAISFFKFIMGKMDKKQSNTSYRYRKR